MSLSRDSGFFLILNLIFRFQSDLPHVEIYRTRKFSFRPIGLQAGASVYNLHSSRVPISSDGGQHTSVWNCDGEIIHDSELSIR